MPERLTGFYPGSRTPVREYTGTPDPGLDLGEGQWLMVDGNPSEFFTIGVLSAALNRQPVTIRKWEREGVIPKPEFHDPRLRGLGKRRLYTREQIETAVKIATEEGILHDFRPILLTQFSKRLYAAWKEIAE
jgi:hypothetical protein